MRVKLVQLDGKLPDIALMKLAHWHRERGDDVILSRTVRPNLFEQHDSGAVYGSAIFKKSAPMAKMLREVHPGAVVGGTGSGEPLGHTVEQQLGVERYEHYDSVSIPSILGASASPSGAAGGAVPAAWGPGRRGSRWP